MEELYPANPRIKSQIDLFKKRKNASNFPMLFLDLPVYHPELFKQPFRPLGLERQMLNTLKDKFGIELPKTILESAVYVEIVKSINRAATYFPNPKAEPSTSALAYLKERSLEESIYLSFIAGEHKAISAYFNEGHPTYGAHLFFVRKRALDLNLEGLAAQGIDLNNPEK